jgi:Fumarylacetoacetate (FAA) hydrolase family
MPTDRWFPHPVPSHRTWPARRTFWLKLARPLWYEQPLYYKGNPATFIGDGDTVRWPAYAQTVDYELEIGVVIVRDGSDLTPA